jgi:predicted dehydrogenase
MKGTAIAAGVTVLTGRFKVNAYAANATLNTANVGVSGRGENHIGAAAGENLVAICDTNGDALDKVAAKYPNAKKYTDWRKMYDAHKDLNAVFVATPDHTHFPAAMRAVAQGAGVYVEKPLTHTIWEARTLTEAVRKAKVASQMGNQGHSNEGWRVLCEYMWAGLLGNVTLVECATNRPIWPQGRDRPAYTDPVPPTLNWDVWLGTSPARPYASVWREAEGNAKGKHKGVYTPFVWRGWWDFGAGALGDMACHIMDGPFWSLKLAEAKTCTIEAESGGATKEMGPNWSIITYQFPARGDMPPVTIKWYDGGKYPPRPKELEPDRKLDTGGQSIFHGDKNVMIADTYGGSVRIIPEAKQKETPKPEKTLPRAKNYHGDFLAACRGGPPASSNFDYSGPFTEMVLLGNLALRLGKKIEWDFPSMKAKNCPEADALVHPPYRPGFGV